MRDRVRPIRDVARAYLYAAIMGLGWHVLEGGGGECPSVVIAAAGETGESERRLAKVAHCRRWPNDVEAAASL